MKLIETDNMQVLLEAIYFLVILHVLNFPSLMKQFYNANFKINIANCIVTCQPKLSRLA